MTSATTDVEGSALSLFVGTQLADARSRCLYIPFAGLRYCFSWFSFSFLSLCIYSCVAK